ncbi:universal stress protein [Roseinatronobacter alkalisoli]|uniref:Universal stress protein n=1 Tax=Roseinatronobacter alkalisoli TaxID=3028235 RepID=A0ABT5T5A8_9RHOB|nr:universal stress protein [Roseinatronobacter sp. HJB301]MDD7970300.1 universal stress protein [Roseinatronobacter sp. HJB301]
MYQSIVVAVALFNKGATSRGMIEKANKLVDAGGSVTLVHVMDEIPAYLTAAVSKEQLLNHRKSIRAQLESLAARVKAKNVDIDLRGGRPSENILKCAKDCNADLIMIASHKPGMSDYFIGSTAARVVRHSPISVLIAR